MKKSILLSLAILAMTSLFAQLKPVDQGSTVSFKIRNLGFAVNGSLNGLDGSIHFDPNEPEKSHFDVTVNATSINTNNNTRDGHLRGENYFDATNHTKIKMVSDKITGKSGAYVFNGQLTIKGKTNPVSFPFTATPTSDGFQFQGSFKMNRKDFGIGGSSPISNELEVTLNVIAKK